MYENLLQFNFYWIGFEQKHDRRFTVLEHQCGRLGLMRKRSMGWVNRSPAYWRQRLLILQ